MDELQKKLHDIRKEIDALLQSVEGLKTNPVALVAARNLAICYTHLEDAKMRLGKALGDLGSELPAQFADKAEKPAQQVGQAAQAAPAQPTANAETTAQPAQPAAPAAPADATPAAPQAPVDGTATPNSQS